MSMVDQAKITPTTPPATESTVLSVSSWRTSRHAAGAQRRAHGELAIAAQHPREREVGDVRARDQQNQPRRAEQNQQHLARADRELLEHVRRFRLEAAGREVDVRIVALEALAHRRHFRGGRLRRRVRLEQPEHLDAERHGGSWSSAFPPARGTDRPRSACTRRLRSDNAAPTGSTPTTVCGRSFISKTCPMMPGSPPNFVCQ